ncbi:MAG: hypothetical protein KatS3mg102_1916 [Planctomycetota bacterium]|nr:MAG: hypothetical protein KatS3mg102_1916 [Planctomycetota bacterium]
MRFEQRFALIAALALGLALAWGSGAAAQTQTGGGAGAGTGTGAPAPAAPDHGDTMDMPFAKPDTSYREDEDQYDEGDVTFYDEDVPTRGDSLYFVIDISGSMSWGTYSYTGLDGNTTTGNRLDRAKVELVRAISALTEDFHFNVVAYHCSSSRWRPQRVQATPENKASASAWVNALEATGATGTGPAVALALSDKENFTVVLLSDGAPNCGASGFSGHLNMINSANTQGAVINTFGIGAYGEFENFLRQVAEMNGGTYVPVN